MMGRMSRQSVSHIISLKPQSRPLQAANNSHLIIDQGGMLPEQPEIQSPLESLIIHPNPAKFESIYKLASQLTLKLLPIGGSQHRQFRRDLKALLRFL
ncbi:uncharacterized protein DS421_19g644840 [Arachis hypogaea]|uniref:Uncharacterized protein n=1 Tax=Arachis hypogaea TaxID=3818 RepID=A0A6B9V567_ARAHY|nr:uncharacterized protein DS421_19g644840 [Arachis hypogaea]